MKILGHTGASCLEGQARTCWLTGFSGAGKSTLANALAHALRLQSRSVCVLDGDELRAGLCSDLGFSAADREENMRRTAHLARLLNDQGIHAIAALISPTRAGRASAREIITPERFVEIHVNTPLEVCLQRDPKGLYARAQQDQTIAMTGLKAPYEPPEQPDLRINPHEVSLDEAVNRLLSLIIER